MAGTPSRSEQTPADPTRVGIVPLALNGPSMDVFRLLLLRVNTLQSALEFSILPVIEHPFLEKLRSKAALDREEVLADAPAFLADYARQIAEEATTVGLLAPPANGYVIQSTARFADNYYATSIRRLQIIALGHWARHMAPPSMLEFFLFLTVRYGIAFAPDFTPAPHYGTKGCLWDSSPYLDEARYKILTGFVCSDCRVNLARAGLGELSDILPTIVRGHWLGDVSDPTSPAGLARKLGHDLFITKGLKQTLWESLKVTLSTEGPKELLKIIGGVVAVAILVWLGLKIP